MPEAKFASAEMSRNILPYLKPFPTMKALLSVISCYLLTSLLHSATTPIPETIQMAGFSVTYKINNPEQWKVSILDEKTRLHYERMTEEELADFNVLQISLDDKFTKMAPRKIADAIIRGDKIKLHKIVFGGRTTLLFENGSKFSSKIGPVFFCQKPPRFEKTPFSFPTYAALILPEVYQTRRTAYVVTWDTTSRNCWIYLVLF